MAMNPMEQFEVKPLIEAPLFSIGGHPIYFTNQALFMLVAVGLAALFLTLTVSKNRLVPTRGQSLAEVSYEFVANMINSTMGHDGLKFFPLIFTIFVFVLFNNFLGLVPWTFTATSQIAITFTLASFVILTMVVVGFMKHGLRFFSLFVPEAPWYLLLLLVPIEVISFLTRPISLSVRLFANMLAGHTLLAVFASFVVLMTTAGGIMYGVAVAPFALIVCIYVLEMLVAFLQAYVFAVLTCIYLNEALHLHDHH
ncbi:F-type H+-transporting ATPase subunit a [Rhizomicrobium palustre]|uniref:ATP synthase subunit a n=2 Tax=Rhizomicrobium palustre TaxID=189966 RepID=A0A846N534_9PROT|nr:F-type H+-transporting ATPase subunit a [Rhizomicrobium palustre]